MEEDKNKPIEILIAHDEFFQETITERYYLDTKAILMCIQAGIEYGKSLKNKLNI